MIRYLLACIISLFLAGCAVGPDYKPPVVAVPKHWHEAPNTFANQQPDKWWETFNDPTLNRLITEAITANLNLKQALSRVKEARALRWSTIAAGLPTLSAKSSASRRFNNSSVAGQSGNGNVGGGFGIGGQQINIFQLGFDAQWELDFFGGVRRAVEAVDATVESEVENSRHVLVTLLGDVASNYIELRENQQQADITRNNLAAQRDVQDLSEIRQQAGLVSMLDATQAQAQADTTEAQLPNYEARIQQSIHALSVLLGRDPGALASRLAQHSTIPSINTTRIADLPSDLLKRRPDIRKAERQLAYANASVGVATAELYPKINLAAFLGLQNTTITDFTPIGKSWSAASTLTMPIFNWGKLNANIQSKKAQFEQAFLAYQNTVLTAFQEVEDALIASRQEQQRHLTLTQALSANQLAVQLATERYQKGLTGFIDVLQSQQALYQTESLLTTSQASIASHQIALYKALGGGWQTEARVSDTSLKTKKY